MTTKPVDVFHIGAIRAAIRRNATDKDSSFNVTFSRIYKDDKGNWKFTSSFGHEDLLEFAKLADWAHTNVSRFEAEDRRE